MSRSHRPLAALAVLAAGATALAALALPSRDAGGPFAPDRPLRAPAPTFDPHSTAGSETAVLSGGCFWGLQAVFEHVRGVRHVTAGYAGGGKATASYDVVSTGATGHAESVEIVFDPRQVSYGELLRLYVSVATDPTQRDRQYPDVGPQYRGEIWYSTPQQKLIAERYLAQLAAAHVFNAPVATRVDRFGGFYPAEGYHQDYLIKNPSAGYIVTFDKPKLAALRQLFPDDWRETPARF